MGCGVKIAPGPPEARIDGAPENLDALAGRTSPSRALSFSRKADGACGMRTARKENASAGRWTMTKAAREGAMKRAAVLLMIVSIAIALAVPAVVSAGLEGFELGGTAARAEDPADSENDVISTNVTDTTFGFVRRGLKKRTQVEDLSGQVSFHFRFDTGGSCGGGSPRIQLAIDTDGDGVSNGNAFGHPLPLTGCPANTWLFVDLTDNSAAIWDLSQFNDDFPVGAPGWPQPPITGPGVNPTWSQVLTLFGAFPNHHVLTGGVFDDTFTGSGRGSGLGFYDNIEIGDKKLQDP